jgi:hypothetical protein
MFWMVNNGDWRRIRVIDEFGAGSHVACAQAAIVNGRKGQLGVVPTYKDLAAVQYRDLTCKPPILGPTGTTLAGIYRDLSTLARPSVPKDKLLYWGYTDGVYSQTTVKKALAACNGGRKFLIVQVHDAEKLWHNEQGVKSHFIAILGFSDLRLPNGNCLVANGDREPHSNIPDWIPLSNIMSAQPCGLLAVTGFGS